MKNSAATAVQNAFIDKFLVKSDPMYCNIYILALRLASSGEEISISRIGSLFGISLETVEASFDYWREKGVISGKENIMFNVLSENKMAALDIMPNYTVSEIEQVSAADENVKQLFRTVQSKFGRPLKYSEMNLFLRFYDWLNLPLFIIESLLDYCIENDKTSARYMETVALDWAENDIRTKESLQGYLTRFDDFRKIMHALCLPRSRAPKEKEKELMTKWLNEYALPMELILEACDRSVVQTGSSNFKYADKIIGDWSKNGLKTLADVDVADAKFESEKVGIKTKKPSQSKRKFQNYEERASENVDQNEIMKKERELLLKQLKD